MTIQTDFNPAKGAPKQAMGCQLVQNCAIEVQVDNICNLSLIHQADHLVVKGLVKLDLPFINPC